MKLTVIAQIVVGGTVLLGGVVTPLVQQIISQTQNNINLVNLTLEQLAFYDGTNGKKAYIAYQGDIYDVSDAEGWTNGMHEGLHLAGRDCTEILSGASHGDTVIPQLRKIGVLVPSQSSSESSITSSSSSSTVTTEVCVWIEEDDAIRFDDDHDDDDDEDEDDEDDGYWSCTNTQVTSTTGSSTPLPDNPASDGYYYLTESQLAYYDGTNGKPAWVSIFGTIYDVTTESGWRNGVHKGLHLAGTNATSFFEGSPHTMTILNGVRIVGYLVVA
jgi:predicted heme/steroid binding protein